jgi:N-methylhydantoinase B
MQPGDWIVSGTGGFDAPVERDPTRVRKDMLDDWISEERAAEIYGVIWIRITASTNKRPYPAALL